MSRKTYLFYLFSINNKPYYINEHGFVEEGTENYSKQNGEPAYLQTDPKGWQNVVAKFARNIKYMGVFRDMSLPLDYEKDAAKILRYLMGANGFEATCNLGILKLDRLALPYSYRPWYLSEINFAKSKDSLTAFNAETLEGGLSKYLKAYEDTVYSIPIADDPEHINVIMDGMEIGNSATFGISDGFSADPRFNFGNHLLQADVVSKEIEKVGGVQTVTRTKVSNNNPLIVATGLYAFTTTTAGQITIEYDFNVTITFTPPPAINPTAQAFIVARLIDVKTNISTVQHVMLNLKTNQITGNPVRVKGTTVLDVRPGLNLYLYSFLNVEGATGDIQTSFQYSGDNPYFKITYTYRHPKSIVKALYGYRLLEAIVEQMTGKQYKIKSDFLKQKLDICFTSGSAIRNMQKSIIQTSLTEFFKACGFFGVGLGIENNVLVLELLKYFFSDEIIIDLGEVNDATLEVAQDLVFNTFNAGWKEQTYEGINGIYEVNQGQQWQTPIKKIVNNYDYRPTYRADALGIELLRINWSTSQTTDTSSDNDTCLLSIDPATNDFTTTAKFITPHSFTIPLNQIMAIGQKFTITGSGINDGTYTVQDVRTAFFSQVVTVVESVQIQPNVNVHIKILTHQFAKLYRPAFSSLTGVPYPASIFNVLFSPKTGILNNGAYLHSILDKMDDKQITLTSADKNKDLSYTLNGVTVTEAAPITIGDLPAKIFQPTYINVKKQAPYNMVEIMSAKPYGLVTFTWQGKTYTGYLVDGSINGATNEVQEWKLLSHTSNNLTNFNNA